VFGAIMNNEIWFEEELGFRDENIELELLGADSGHEISRQQILDIAQGIKGIIRVHPPLWRLLDSTQMMKSEIPSYFYLIRLGYEFYVPKNGQQPFKEFVSARCEAYLWSQSEPQPSVVNLFPCDLYDGSGVKIIRIKTASELKIEHIEKSGEFNFGELQLGHIEAETIGYFGEQQQMPFWEIDPLGRSLHGTRHFWMVVQVPQKHKCIRLSARAEGKVQTTIGRIVIGPKTNAWNQRKNIQICTQTIEHNDGGDDIGIAPELYRRLQKVLLKCGPFNTDQELRAVFVDKRISSWRDKLPEATDRTKRVNGVIDFLYRQNNEKKEKALVLFLQVLGEQVPIQDICHRQLMEIARKL
jgi:hypothetical protein